jgi:hypothetical protein
MCFITKLKNKLNPGGTLVVSSSCLLKRLTSFSSTIHGTLFSFGKKKKIVKEKKRKENVTLLYFTEKEKKM